MQQNTYLGGFMPNFGRIYAPDPRDAQYPMRLLLEQPGFPRFEGKKNRTYRCGPVLDQGATGTCVGHGWAAWLQGAPLMTKTGMNPFQIYDEAIVNDEFSDNDIDPTRQFGTSVRAGVKVLQAHGHVMNYLWAQSVEDIRSWHLADQGCIVLGIDWYADMMETDQNGFIHASGEWVGGHCIKTTGWSDTRDAVRLQNSWGVTWGQFGRAWLGRDDLARLLAQQGEACAATEQKVAA